MGSGGSTRLRCAIPALVLPVMRRPRRQGAARGPLGETLAEHSRARRLAAARQRRAPCFRGRRTRPRALRDLEGPTVLVTSRERLQIQGEHTWAVPSLGGRTASRCSRREHVAPAGLRSTRLRGGALRSARQPSAGHRARRRAHRRLLAEQLLERLGQRLDLLKGGARRRSSPADPAGDDRVVVRAAHDEEQRLFSACGLRRRLHLRGGGAGADADLDTLQSLLDKSLVRRARRTTRRGTGCSRRSTSTRPSAWAPPAFRRRHVPAPRPSPSTSSRTGQPRRPSGGWRSLDAWSCRISAGRWNTQSQAHDTSRCD